jgi:hypothetical protein
MRRPSDRCPECNWPVSPSIAASATLPPRFFSRFRFVAVWFAVLHTLDIVMSIAGYVQAYSRRFFGSASTEFLISAGWHLLKVAGFTVACVLLLRLVESLVRPALRRVLFSFAAALLLLGTLLNAAILLNVSGTVSPLFRAAMPLLLLATGAAVAAALATLVLQVFILSAMRTIVTQTLFEPLRRPTLWVLGANVAAGAVTLAHMVFIYASLYALRLGGLHFVEELRFWMMILMSGLLVAYWVRAARLVHHLVHR